MSVPQHPDPPRPGCRHGLSGPVFTLVVVLRLPRSARLAAWGTAVLADAADPTAAQRSITGDD